MDDLLAKRVRAAAISCWWTVLIGAIFITAAYGGYLTLMCARPEWVVKLWGGGDLTWAGIQKIYLVAIALFKLMLFGLALIALWLSLFTRRLRKMSQ